MGSSILMIVHYSLINALSITDNYDIHCIPSIVDQYIGYELSWPLTGLLSMHTATISADIKNYYGSEGGWWILQSIMCITYQIYLDVE